MCWWWRAGATKDPGGPAAEYPDHFSMAGGAGPYLDGGMLIPGSGHRDVRRNIARGWIPDLRVQGVSIS